METEEPEGVAVLWAQTVLSSSALGRLWLL